MSGAERAALMRETRAAAVRLPAEQPPDAGFDSAFAFLRPAGAEPVWPCLADNHEPVHLRILERRLQLLIVAHPHDMHLKTVWISFQRGLAHGEIEAGQHKEAARRLDCASKALNEMLCFDPANEMWVRQRETLDQDLSNIAIA